MNEMRLNILYQFNEAYVLSAGVSMTSLFFHNTMLDDICVYILGENLSEKSIDLLKKAAEKYGREIVFLQSNKLIEKMQKIGMPKYRNSYAANMRLFISEVIGPNVGKILYLDADTVITGSLAELLVVDMGDYPLAMCLDSIGNQHKKQLGFQREESYFNSGVILFALDIWKRKKCGERIVDHILNVRSNYAAPDQDLLNVVLKGEIMKLPPKYNFQPVHSAFSDKLYFRVYPEEGYYSRVQLETSRNSVCIFHAYRFLGEFPWCKGNLHPNRYVFDEMMKESFWSQCDKKEASLPFLIKIEKVLYLALPKAVYLPIFMLAHDWFIQKANRMSLKNRITRWL